MDKLKQRWGLTSNWQVIAILLAFTINGTFATMIAKPLTQFMGINQSDGFIFWLIRIPLIFIVYQITLPISGWFFGQFKFFWNFEKKMIRRLGLGRFLKDEN